MIGWQKRKVKIRQAKKWKNDPSNNSVVSGGSQTCESSSYGGQEWGRVSSDIYFHKWKPSDGHSPIGGGWIVAK
jgi:hypothetical protein